MRASSALRAGALVVGASLAVTSPLATYAVSLALFGLPHIAYELRYVDRRFSRRVPRALWMALVALGALLVALRALFVAHLLPGAWQAPFELGLLAALVVATAPVVARAHAGLFATAVVVVAAAALGALALSWPVAALTVFALLHNATPIGFFVEAAPRPQRAQALRSTSLLYLGAPIVVLLAVLAGAPSSDVAPRFIPGTLADYLRTYVPTFVPADVERALFSAAVLAQLLHYHATIVVMPRLGRALGDVRGAVAWPRDRVFLVVVAALAAVLAAAFWWSFRDGRALYGIPAAFHAWIEVPLLVVGLAGAVTAHRAQTAAVRPGS